MKKPSSKLLRLYELGSISAISVEYRQTGTETADTFATITGSQGSLTDVVWDCYREFLDVRVWTNTVAVIKRQYSNEIEEWRKFEDNNANELAEYERLKAKFG